MLESKPIEKILFFDIETTSQYPTFKSMPEKLQYLFKKRFKKEFEDVGKVVEKHTSPNATQINNYPTIEEQLKLEEESYEEVYSTKAPLFAEFGRILCISMGLLTKVGEEYHMKIVTYSDENEKVLLEKFLKGTDKITGSVIPEYHWCAHNADNFDIPFIIKRLILHKLTLPKMLDCAHLKPWERNFIIDTKTVWKFGVYDNNTSLELLCEIMGVPSSKDDVDGSQVKNIFWIDKDLKRICTYCEKDIIALATVYLRMKGIYNNIKQI